MIKTNKCIVIITLESATKIVNFMTPVTRILFQGRGNISHIVKMLYFIKSLPLYSKT